MAPFVPDTVHTPDPDDGSTENTTGFPDPPPVAVSVADPPTLPVAGAVKLIDCDAMLTVWVMPGAVPGA